MQKGEWLYQQYLNILREELRPAMGCTEPIALAYAGARARQVLDKLPEKIFRQEQYSYLFKMREGTRDFLPKLH